MTHAEFRWHLGVWFRHLFRHSWTFGVRWIAPPLGCSTVVTRRCLVCDKTQYARVRYGESARDWTDTKPEREE